MDYTVTDADAHFLETIESLVPYIDEPWQSRIENNRNLMPATTGDRTIYGRVQRTVTDYHSYETEPEQIPEIMDQLGFDNIVLLSQQMLLFPLIEADDERMNKLCSAYTDYMLDEVVDVDEGIYTMAPVPYRDPDAAVELIERVGDEPGLIGICLTTARTEFPLGNRKYDPIYEIAEEKGLAANFHAGGGGLNELNQKGFERFMETHVLGFLFYNMSQLVSIVVQGIPEKFPDLDICFQESGIGWVPMIMDRLDAEYMKRQSEAPLLQKRPSQYINDFYFGTQPLEIANEERLERTIEAIGGPDQLMYASDFPHWDYDDQSVITDLDFLTEDEKQRILHGTAQEAFGL